MKNPPKNPFSAFLRSMLQWFRSYRIRREPSRFPRRAEPALPALSAAEGSLAKGQGAGKAANMTSPTESPSSLTPEQFRQMLHEMLSDPQTRRLLQQSLVGPLFPIQGGNPGTAGRIAKFTSNDTAVEDSIIQQTGDNISGNVGIGITGPDVRLRIEQSNSGDVVLKALNTVSQTADVYVASFRNSATFNGIGDVGLYVGTDKTSSPAVTWLAGSGVSATDLAFRTGGTERMRILSSAGLKNGSFATGRKERGLQGRGVEAN